jgi:hypothetical protein
MADIAIERERWFRFAEAKAEPLRFISGGPERPESATVPDDNGVLEAVARFESARAAQIVAAAEAAALEEAALPSPAEDAAKEEDRQDDMKRPFIRNEQRGLLVAAVVTAETIFGAILAGTGWVAWKSLEFWRTMTKSPNPFLKLFTVRMNMPEKATFAIGLIFIVFLFFVVLPSTAFLIWVAMNPIDAYVAFPELRPLFLQFLPLFAPNFIPSIGT